MNSELQKLQSVWLETQNKGLEITHLPQVTFDDLTNSIISTGPFYYYVIDFFDMSLSNVSPGIYDVHGFDPKTVTFNDVLEAIHPDDIDFTRKAEAFAADYFYNNVEREKILKYKKCYNLRGKLKDGSYGLINHQALMLTLDSNGGYGKCLNIHTQIDHLTSHNTYKFSLIGLDSEPSYMNLDVDCEIKKEIPFSRREIDIIKYIGDGLNNNQIADKLFISNLTVKKHRNNILAKSNCKNTAQLIKNSVIQGLI